MEQLQSDQSAFASRRQRVLNALTNGTVLVVEGASQCTRNADTHYPFRQDSRFYYLTGYESPDTLAVFSKDLQGHTRFVLFCLDRDPVAELWDGVRYGCAHLQEVCGADEALPCATIDEEMPRLLAHHPRVLCNIRNELLLQRVQRWSSACRAQRGRALDVAPSVFEDSKSLFERLRVCKDEAELNAMREAARITVDGHLAAMAICRPGVKEYQLEAALIETFMRQGCRSCAYPSIVATGKNACTLHYVLNQSTVEAGDLVLIDAGAEYAQYAADVTRTFPANGRFSGAQAELYNLVLSAQLAAIAVIKPGIPYGRIHETAVHVLTEGLVALGLLKGDVATLIADGAYRTYYPHGTGHWLGLDVHDEGPYGDAKKPVLLEEGMVLTVEPGLYIPNTPAVHNAAWNGLGIRIEDDVCVTAQGYEVLTQALPKTIGDLEAVLGTR
ncbi:MAG: aminopeptidase P N-terminal domain-containing protein [Pseudomonadota bacterium]